MRARIFLLVLICAAPAVLGSLVAMASLARVHTSVVELDDRSVKPLASLGDLRDMEGDMRDSVWAYLAADTPDERAEVATEVTVADDQADADIEGYLVANGSRTDKNGVLMSDFATKLAAWRQIRDEQVFPLADADQAGKAYAARDDALGAADEAMAQPLDDLYTAEVAEAATQRKSADSSYSSARIVSAGIIGVGLLVALVVAWWLTAGMLRAVGAISRVLADPDPRARVGVDDGSEIGAVGRALDAMLDEADARDTQLQQGQEAREAQLREARVRQQLAEQGIRQRAQGVVDDTATAVLTELEKVAGEAQVVRAAASSIDESVEAADRVTREMVARAEQTDSVVEAVNDSLRRVAGIADLIAGVAAQTNLLALNATIEAARAGDAGKGFAVVAEEVKLLAAETERSITEINQTLAVLESDAGAMASTIQGITAGIGSLDSATGDLRTVAAQQQQTAAQLDASLGGAIERIQAMSGATSKIDRRTGARAAVTGEVQVSTSAGDSVLRMLDISETGIQLLAGGTPNLTMGAGVRVHLRVGDLTETIRAEVARRASGAEGDEVGLTFLGLSQRAREQIAKYVRVLLDDPAAKIAGLTA